MKQEAPTSLGGSSSQRIEKEDFKKSKFMKNFIFNDKIQELYLWYFRNKMEKHTIDIIIDDVL